MKNSFLIILLTFTGQLHAGSKTDSILNVLNKEIDNRTTYFVEKQHQIDTFKQQLSTVHTGNEAFTLCNRIFDEYKSYQYDSAYVYANKTIQIAGKLKDTELLLKAKCNLLFCFRSSGLFKEAFDIVSTLDISKASEELKSNYYFQCARLYNDLAVYNETDPYKNDYDTKKRLYCDSALIFLSSGTYQYSHVMTFKETNNPDTYDKIAKHLKILNSFDLDNHQSAINTSTLGKFYFDVNDVENAIYYMALSSISDIRSAITETTSKTALAKYLYDKGDIKSASRYIKLSLEEANFYNARHRKLEVNSILPIIENDRLNLIASQRDTLTVFLIAVSLLSVLFLIASVVIYKQVKKIKQAKHTIQIHSDQLSVINEKLNESNAIKDQYIVQTLYGKSKYLEMVESLLTKIDRKLKTRQYEELRFVYKEFNIKAERENIFSSFDETFLTLFPNFIHEYNELFKEEDRIVLNKDSYLTPELRIFALIRLGINENERIATFLNLTVQTIYVYKAKVKSKTIVSKEEFEHRIKQIRKPPIV